MFLWQWNMCKLGLPDPDHASLISSKNRQIPDSLSVVQVKKHIQTTDFKNTGILDYQKKV